ncbi:hypothetical protein O181_121368 [Austropuccinia psidii MF-1]|uniref:Uncharacterized protein n=1 Tax=Austropuccinia psidii MF-1 TaxID=1389203 RepID=A0A9Q3KHF4_9BASI|nr:hypothetical protein [Austropuccinia psidii MF-1]
MQSLSNPTMWNIASTTNAICILLRIPSYPSPLERHRNIWPIMGWREVINATSRNAPACATRAHNCLTKLASCRSLFNDVRGMPPYNYYWYSDCGIQVAVG